MKYIVFFCLSHNSGVHTQKLEFFDKELAKKAHAELTRQSRYCWLFEDTSFSVDSLYVELLKSNPLDEPEVLLQRAKDAYELLYPAKVETSLESWSQKLDKETKLLKLGDKEHIF